MFFIKDPEWLLTLLDVCWNWNKKYFAITLLSIYSPYEEIGRDLFGVAINTPEYKLCIDVAFIHLIAIER